ncbi:MAG: hypothetical protein ACOH2L_09895 [Devosia sp.]
MPKIPRQTLLTRRKADAHEALFLRLAALTKQVEAMAARRPAAPVPEGLAVLAEGALYEARQFAERRHRRDLPVAAPHCGALAAQLATVLAGLVAFEARRSRWDGVLQAQIWQLKGEPRPVPLRRLRPKLDTAAQEGRDNDMVQLQAAIERRIKAITKGRRDEPVLARTYAPRPARQTYPRVTPPAAQDRLGRLLHPFGPG